MITLRNMEIFNSVVAHGTMAGAAKALYISQSAISQAISDLEAAYGVRLFDRVGKQLLLTPTGEQLLIHSRKLLAEKDTTENFLAAAAKKDTLRVGATLTVGATVIWPILEMLRRMQPGVRPVVQIFNTEALEKLLIQGKMDLALVEGRVRDSSLRATPVIEDKMVLICGRSHPFWSRDKIQISDLAGQGLVLREEGSGTRRQLLDVLDAASLPYEITATCSSIDSLRMAVIHGYGLSYISQRLVEEDVRRGNLRTFVLEGAVHSRQFSLVQMKSRVPTQAMENFTACVNAFAADMDIV